MPRIGLLLLSLIFDLALLRPLLIEISLAPHQTRRAYFERVAGGQALLLDEQYDGYFTDIQLDEEGRLEIPAGRTIAIPLQAGSEITVRTVAPDLAPYIVLGFEVPVGNANQATRLADPMALVMDAGTLRVRPWDASRPWAEDKAWLRDVHTQCRVPADGGTAIRVEAENFVVHLGSCAARIPFAANKTSVLGIITGPHAAGASSAGGWASTMRIHWRLVLIELVRFALLAFAIGPGPTAVASATLLAAGQLSRPAAILCWFATLPIAVAAAVGRLISRYVPRRPALAWTGAALVLAVELCAIIAAIALLDVGTFGNTRITRAGDDGCAIVGYSTVRGDSLREGSAGVIERLNEECAKCRNRTSRFSREAQTLRWIREVVCSPSFPAPAGGEVVFLGGGNDDLFYRPARLAQRVGDFVGTIRYAVQPIAAADWEAVFGQANQRVVGTLDEQAADIAAIAQCANHGDRRLRFVHDFLIWDLDHGRSPARQQAFERRRAAVLAAGGDFVDLLDEFGATAGVSWFNDFIHPSALAQEMIADRLCARLTSDVSP